MTTIRPVLIVDDDADTREALQVLLRAEGYYVASATNGFEAIQKSISSPKPCVILLDDRMPLMSGLEFLEHRARDPRLQEVPVILATANPGTLREFSARGATAFARPFDLDGLLGVVHEHCA